MDNVQGAQAHRNLRYFRKLVLKRYGEGPQIFLSRSYQTPSDATGEIDRQLDEMLATDPPICRPSNSPWASDVVLVKKNEGT